MNRDKTKKELLKELENLHNEINSLKAAFNNENSNTVKHKIEQPFSESTFDNLTQSLQEGILIANSKGKLIYANPFAVRNLGYPIEELLQTSLHDLVNPEAFIMLQQQNIHDQMDGLQIPSYFKTIIRRKDGTSLHAEISGSKTCWQGQDCNLVVIRDISRQMKVEGELISANNLLREREKEIQNNYSILNSAFESPENIIIFSLDTNYRYLSFTDYHRQTMKKLWNTDISVGMNILDAISVPDDRKKAKNNFDRALRGEHFVEKEEYGDETLFRTFYDDYYSPIKDSEGTIIGISIFVIDLTRLNKTMEAMHETNSYLENLFNFANAPIIVWDPQFRITRFNHAFEFLTGLREEEVNGKPLEILFPPEHIEKSMSLIRKTITGERWETVEIKIQHRDQTIRTVLWNSATLFAADGHTPVSIITQGQDITTRKQAEEAMKESEEKFRSLYANMNEGSALHTLVYNDQGVPVDYLINEVNPAFEYQLGISREAVINKTSRAAYGVDAPPYFEIYSRVALSGNPEVFETYFAPLDKHFSISVYCPYKGSFATIFENITERKLAEQTLNILLAKYKVLFDTLPIGITITDDTGKIIESNQIAGTLLGISREEQEKRKIDGHEWRIIRPDGSAMPVSEFASVKALEQNRPVTNVEMGIVKGKDVITWLNVSATPIPIQGYGVAIIYGDITERKQAENENERIQKLLEDSQRIGKIGGWEYNIDTRELKWTKEMYNIQEVDLTFVPAVDKRVNFYTPETLPAIDNAIKQAIEHGDSFEVDAEIITAKGNRRSVKTIGKADLENRRIFGLFQDITERKKVEAELSIKNEQLKELNATKDKFFSIIAHDLKSPFSSILGFSEMLKDEARDLDIDSIVQYAGIINSSAQHTFELLENLLDWARMQQGRIPFEPKAFLLYSIINAEFEGLKETANQKNISLIDGINENIIIKADENMIRTVIRNLISNAIKFTPKGGQVEVKVEVKVEVEVENGQDEDNQVVISVSDNGVGMTNETIGKLFKIETSFTTRGTENEKGTGLGLLLCKEFIEKHDGRIWVESELGKGSTFSFSLPLV